MTEPQNVSRLMDQIHDLKAQLADAEKRGGVKALRGHAAKCRDMAERHPEAALVFRNYANDLDDAAAQSESGEVTL